MGRIEGLPYDRLSACESVGSPTPVSLCSLYAGACVRAKVGEQARRESGRAPAQRALEVR